MIVRYPEMSEARHPIVMLLGSYGPADARNWRAKAAAHLDGNAGTVVVGSPGFVDAGAGALLSFARWASVWLEESDIFAMWIGSAEQWTEFEFGFALGRHRGYLVVGVSEELANARRLLCDVTAALRYSTPIHEDFDEWLHAVRDACCRARIYLAEGPK